MRRLSGLVVVATIALVGCGLIGRQLQLTVPGRGERSEPLPVTLIDRTGSVAGLDVVPENFEGAFDRGVSPVPGRPAAIVMQWIGGACDEGATVTLEDRQGSMWLTVETTGSGHECILIGIGRFMVIRFYLPVDASRFHVEQ